ncbi:hypothetical protein MMC26_003148 [Xylographa opegraphella]|nr:hypothetical protein [Xylographa opegraphella]
MITIRVGSDASAETFILHKELAAHHSTKLALMMDDAIKLENPGALELPDFSPEEFEVFEAWIYRQKLDHDNWSFILSAHLYIFSEGLGAPGMQNAVLDTMGEMVRDDPQCVPTEALALHLIWERTLHDSPLRALLADVLAFEMSADDCSQYVRGFPTDLTVRILEVMKSRVSERRRNEVAPFDFSMEEYYVEEAGEEAE